MRLTQFLPLVLLACLAGCATPVPDSSSATDASAAKAMAASPSMASDQNPLCHAYMHAGRIRPGDNLPVAMEVKNTGRWCFNGFGWSGDTVEGSSIAAKPDHGEVRLIVRGNSLLYGYRPGPGFSGHDSFLIEVPSGIGESVNLAISGQVAT